MVRIRDTSIYWTNLSTLGTVMEANALGALAGVDDIDCLTLADCLVGTLWLASATANAFVRYLICHEKCLLLFGEVPLSILLANAKFFS